MLVRDYADDLDPLRFGGAHADEDPFDDRRLAKECLTRLLIRSVAGKTAARYGCNLLQICAADLSASGVPVSCCRLTG